MTFVTSLKACLKCSHFVRSWGSGFHTVWGTVQPVTESNRKALMIYSAQTFLLLWDHGGQVTAEVP